MCPTLYLSDSHPLSVNLAQAVRPKCRKLKARKSTVYIDHARDRRLGAKSNQYTRSQRSPNSLIRYCWSNSCFLLETGVACHERLFLAKWHPKPRKSCDNCRFSAWKVLRSIAVARQRPRTPQHWWCSFTFFEYFLWHLNSGQSKIFIAGGGCLTGESEPSRAAVRFWFIRLDAPPTGYDSLSFNPYLDRLFVVWLKKRSINPYAEKGLNKPVWNTIHTFHVFIFYWLPHDNGRDQLKEVIFSLSRPVSCRNHENCSGSKDHSTLHLSSSLYWLKFNGVGCPFSKLWVSNVITTVHARQMMSSFIICYKFLSKKNHEVRSKTAKTA